MGWNHADGNMCNSGAANGYAKTEWPSVGSSIFQEFFKAGELPYTDLNIFNTNFFSFNELHRPDPGFDIVKNGVLYIGERMPRIDSHKKQTDFTKVVISPSVEVIKGSAFYDTNLSEINIPPNVTNIGNESFLGCLSLKNIEIPDNVKKVGDGAFENCTSLTKVKIGSGIRQLSKKMFKNSALTEVTIPKNIKFIDNEAFNNCRNLTKVVIEDGVRKIGDNAFGGTALTEIIIPPSVTMIGKNITSKNVVWNVKEGSFAHTFAIENKFLVGTLADKGKMILAECENAENAPNDVWKNGVFTKEDTRRKWDFSNKLSDAEGGRYSVRFIYTDGTDTLRLTDTLFTADGKAIGYFAEMRSVGEKQRETVYEITVPQGTKKLEMFALARAGKSDISGTITVNNMTLKKLVIPEGTTSIKDESYFGCKFEEVVFPSGLTKIGKMAFHDSTELKSVTIPDSVTDIGSSTFQNCKSLATAKLSSGLKKLSTKLFKASGLTKITIPSNIETVEDEVFRDCEELKNVTIENGVKKIGKNVFTGSKKLAEITIPDSVTEIAEAAFQNCSSLTTAKIGSGLKTLNYRLFKGTGLTKITIPNNIETIDKEVFR